MCLPQTPIELIALDMDGTLLGADGKVSPRNLAALLAAEQAGLHIVIATGRRHGYAMRQLRGLGLRPDGALISSNGAVTRTLGTGPAGPRLLDRTLLDRPTADWLCHHLGAFRNALILTFDRLGPDGEDLRGALVVEELAELNASIGRWMLANEPYIEHIVPIERSLDREGLLQMMLCGTIDRMREAEARLAEDPRVTPTASPHEASPNPADPIEDSHQAETGESPLPGVALHRTEYPKRDLSILDILPAGCSKGSALRRLAAHHRIPLAACMAIGDNWNDVSMLELAGHPVLMENAPDDLKLFATQRGWTLAGHHHNDAVAEAIEEALQSRASAMAAPGGRL